jgi:hypothetical protein
VVQLEHAPVQAVITQHHNPPSYHHNRTPPPRPVRFTGEAPLPGSAEVIGNDTRVVQEAPVSLEERGAVRHRTEFADVSEGSLLLPSNCPVTELHCEFIQFQFEQIDRGTE